MSAAPTGQLGGSIAGIAAADDVTLRGAEEKAVSNAIDAAILAAERVRRIGQCDRRAGAPEGRRRRDDEAAIVTIDGIGAGATLHHAFQHYIGGLLAAARPPPPRAHHPGGGAGGRAAQ